MALVPSRSSERGSSGPPPSSSCPMTTSAAVPASTSATGRSQPAAAASRPAHDGATSSRSAGAASPRVERGHDLGRPLDERVALGRPAGAAAVPGRLEDVGGGPERPPGRRPVAPDVGHELARRAPDQVGDDVAGGQRGHERPVPAPQAVAPAAGLLEGHGLLGPVVVLVALVDDDLGRLVDLADAAEAGPRPPHHEQHHHDHDPQDRPPHPRRQGAAAPDGQVVGEEAVEAVGDPPDERLERVRGRLVPLVARRRQDLVGRLAGLGGLVLGDRQLGDGCERPRVRPHGRWPGGRPARCRCPRCGPAGRGRAASSTRPRTGWSRPGR